MMKRRTLLSSATAAGALAVVPYIRAQGSLEKFKFNLGWRVEASGAGFLLAQQQGYYKEAGLDCTIDTGNGSAAAIGLVAGGAYDAASADLSTMLEFNGNNPAARLAAVAIQYDLNANSIIVRKGGPIAKPSDLNGKTILGQPFNASRKLFPVFAKAQGIDASTVRWENIDPGVADTLFAKGEFDAAAYFYFTGLLNLKSRGMAPEQLTVFRYSDLGLKSYGNGIVANSRIQQRPEVLKAFVRATTRGWVEAIANPKTGAEAVKLREPMANESLELERLRLTVDGTMRTPDTTANGWGAATPERLKATLDETVLAFGLKPGLTVADLWTDKFLPSRAERQLKA